MKNSDNLVSFSLGMVLGALVGTLAGLLVAPKSGEETRAYVVDELTKLRDEAEDVLSDLSGLSEQWAKKAKQVIQEKIDSINDILKSAREAEEVISTEIDEDYSEFLGEEGKTSSEASQSSQEQSSSETSTPNSETSHKVE
uniref:YtxH domain-containing protein n=1 Tax=Thermodesulfobium narugense TaxID=184064 RepID=A0A7C5P828_9BACT